METPLTPGEMQDKIRSLERELRRHRRFEKQLEASQSRLQAVVDSLPFDFFMLDEDGMYTMVNAHARKHWGDPEGKRPEEIAPDEQTLHLWRENNRRAFQGEVIREEVELSVNGKNGVFQNIISPIYEGDQIVGVMGLNIDITSRKKHERIVRESEQRYRALVEDMPVLICRFLPDGTLTFVNSYYCEYFQIPHSELIGSNFFRFIPEEDRNTVRQKFLNLTAESPSITYEHHAIAPDGKVVWQEWTDRALMNESGQIIEYQSIGRDITDRKRVEETLRKNETRLRKALKLANAGEWERDLDHEEIILSDDLRRIWGVQPDRAISVEKFLEMIHPEDRELVRKEINGDLNEESFADIHYRIQRPDGKERILRSLSRIMRTYDGTTHRIIGVTQDITRYKHMEDQLYRAQKMEAVGTLAGGIAHNFNNLLTAIQGNASLIRMDLPADHPHYNRLTDIEEIVQTGSQLTNQLLGFARRGKMEVNVVEMNTLINTTGELYSETRKAIIFQKELQVNPWKVLGDRNQLEQALMNLFINAGQAMSDKGTIKVTSSNVNLTREFVQGFHVPEGNYVQVTVTDYGTGMDKETQAKIFDPFFTTKDVGRGMGLGLASVYGIILNHDGIITVASAVDEGTTFYIYLPALWAEELEEIPSDAESKSITEEKPSTGRTILLVDDEPMITSVGTAILEHYGYHVFAANSGEEAIRFLEQPETKPDLIILDMIMPGMDGDQTIKELLTIDPKLKVLLCTGYAVRSVDFKTKGFIGIIRKPFKPDQLLAKIREILSDEYLD